MWELSEEAKAEIDMLYQHFLPLIKGVSKEELYDRIYGGYCYGEGVIPLTDSQQMALLGEAIGRYITVNANIINTMNGRIISRELQKVQNESDFAYNR